MMNSNELRKAYFKFFKEKQHQIVESAPMVVKNDPTLMFTNAGMNQFKDIFLGNQEAPHRRVANSQKCLRVSGKHNDLEEVGHDTYHHTMFEMLGNWSFGDYFKKEAIEWAWEFLTSVLNIPEERLYVTVFEGSKAENLERDNESAGYWENCFTDLNNKILNGSKKDNFWEMGDTGPCGPCSEIHIDLRSEKERKVKPGHELVNMNHPLVVEIWNLVFIQYNRKSDGNLEPLPEQHVDTGMGFERLCMAVQGEKSNYDTDIFQSIISEISSICGTAYGSSKETDIAMRVIADHLRAVSFSIADGQLPSNNKAGYVIRRILRRAIRYAYNYLNIEDPFIYRLVPVLANTMGEAFPQLESEKEHISRVIEQEERTFLNTLGKGMKLVENTVNKLIKSGVKVFPGGDAFTLYDTFGFPIDLTQLILKERNMEADLVGFETEMAKQKARSRSDAAKEMDDWVVLNETGISKFTGYDKTSGEIRLSKYRRVVSKGADLYHLVFDKTPFYAEAGGQIGDSGYIEQGKEKIEISDTIKENNLIIHIAETLPDITEAPLKAFVNTSRRSKIEKNHTATHLLHYALKKVLGTHAEQKGSLVTDEKLRFDFSHFEKVSHQEIKEIEQIVNSIIRQNMHVKIDLDVPIADAKTRGAAAQFGEKYDELVRVVTFGESIELCGGTHVNITGSLGLFKILNEGAIAAGIRRIEAITSDTAYDFIESKLAILEDIESLLKSPKDLTENIEKLIAENQILRKKNEKISAEVASFIRKDLSTRIEKIGNTNAIVAHIKADSIDMMKEIATQIRNTEDSVLLAIGSEIDGKAALVVMVSDNLLKEKRIEAGKIIREVSSEIDGGGGGQPFLATAGGKNPDGIDKALQKVRSILERLS